MSVSVVIPAYRSAFVGEALESVLRQTMPPAEIIVVDGSPETTLPQIERHIGRLRYIEQPPRGVSHARNAGILAAGGEYIALLDADDLWQPEKLSTQVALLRRFPEAGFCFSTTWNLVQGSDPTIPREPYRPAALQEWLSSNSQADGAVSGNVYELLLAANCVATSSVVAKKSAVLAIGLFDESVNNGEDYDLWLRLAGAYPAIYVCEPTSRYRVHEQGLSGSWNSRSELFYRANLRVLENHLAGRPSPVARRALARALADFAGFQLKQSRRAAAKETALRSLRLRPSRKAAQLFFEASCPRLYSAAAHLVKASAQ